MGRNPIITQGEIMKFRALAWAALLAVAPAFAAGVDGKWTGPLDTPNGPMQMTFNFKADGAKLTGTNLTPDGMPIPIKNGKVDGANISFSVDVDIPGGGPVTFNYTGVLAGKEIKLHTDFMGMPLDVTVKKTE
jgi:hypothetical protein